MAWTALELRHLPDFLEAVQLLNGCLKALPLAEESKELLKDRLLTFDMALGSYFLNFQPDELRQVEEPSGHPWKHLAFSPRASRCFTPLATRITSAPTDRCRPESPTRPYRRWSRSSPASR